jgi:hypothetical protein
MYIYERNSVELQGISKNKIDMYLILIVTMFSSL